MALSLKQVTQGEYLGGDWKAMLATEQPEPESQLSAALSETLNSAEDQALPNAGRET